MATLLSQHDGSLTTYPDGSHFTLDHLILKNVRMLAGEYMRLLKYGIGKFFTLTECTIEGDIRELHEDVGNQAALQGEASQSASSGYVPIISLEKMTVSADVFMRLVLVVFQSGHDLNFWFTECTIEGDIRELHEDVSNQAALQGEASQSASSGYVTFFNLEKVTVSADVFMRLVLVVSQSGREVNFTLTECTIEGDIRELHEKVGDQTALQGDIRELHEKVGDQTVLQVVAPQPAFYGYRECWDIRLNKVILPAEVLRGLVRVVLQSGRRVNCIIKECTIEPVEEVRKLQVDQPAIQFSLCEQRWCIGYRNFKI
ncbi:hypothetical protein MAR_006976, partial [Mya arenaria]